MAISRKIEDDFKTDIKDRCDICTNVTLSRNRCTICGLHVCMNCFNYNIGICKKCAIRRQKTNTSKI